MQGPRIPLLVAAVAVLALLTAPAATAHERYFSTDDEYLIILGEQNEPVYTYDWTNLDFFVRDNATGHGIAGVEETVNATLIAPGGQELSLEIEPQHGSTGRYEFVQDYFLTQPGQYKVQLEGQVNGTDVTGEYLLPGPRGEMEPQAFPVPVEKNLNELAQDNQELAAQVEDLSTQVSDLESQLSDLQTQLDELEANPPTGDGTNENSANAPGFSLVAAILALGLIAVVRAKGQD